MHLISVFEIHFFWMKTLVVFKTRKPIIPLPDIKRRMELSDTT